VDIHTSYSIWSIIFLTSWKSHPQLCCRKCGAKSKIMRWMGSFLFGWWGIPHGLILTPVQLTRNFIGLFIVPSPNHPSRRLEDLILMDVTDEMKTANQAGDAPPSLESPSHLA